MTMQVAYKGRIIVFHFFVEKTRADSGLGIYLLLWGHPCFGMPINSSTGDFSRLIYFIVDTHESQAPLDFLPVLQGSLLVSIW